MKLTTFFTFILLVIFSSCTSKNSTQKTNKKPNIIYILADDMGYGDVGAYNIESKIKTPGLDKLASDGMMFTDAHTSSAVCTPTRYGILTGRYNWRSRLKSSVLGGSSKALIPNSRATVASILKASGYHTAFIGKWHLGWDWALKDETKEIYKDEEELGDWYVDKKNIDFTRSVTNTPNDLGFEYAYGHCGSLDMDPYVYVENGKPTAIPDTITGNKEKYTFWRKGDTAPDFIHEEVTPNFFRRGINYIKEQANNDKPFFLYLPLPSPHTPILPTEEWQGKSDLNPYGDFVMMVDNYINQLQEAVKSAGIEENTLIIFTTDNGCSPAADIDSLILKGHYPNGIYRGHKADIFEGGHRIPFIAKWPAVIQKGTKNDQVICTTDLMATLADIIDYSLQDDEGEDSYSMMPLFKGEKIEGTFREATVHHSIDGEFAIRKGDWKLIMCPSSGGWSFPRPRRDSAVIATLPPIQLYNLKNDPSEENNLQAENTEKVQELKTLLAKYILDGRSTPGVPQQNERTEDWKQIHWIDGRKDKNLH
ncbi:arylsulfatase [Sabulilitoribacter arenilitoris]|uniref:Arylsulfatase n=2 Tax=Wocania arenilitoris TaxID=2044858 RepID=A0AAE3JKC9_9FLAO|nr:arylsulfatase [Wocania arenilitoris]MCF7567039.1 arylsulfatase [Wocania arenilitoris]